MIHELLLAGEPRRSQGVPQIRSQLPGLDEQGNPAPRKNTVWQILHFINDNIAKKHIITQKFILPHIL